MSLQFPALRHRTGWGGFNLAQSLPTRTNLNVISPSNHFVFTPLLPSTAVGTLEFRAIQECVRTLPSVNNFFQAKAVSIDFKKKKVLCEDIWEHSDAKNSNFTVSYDKLVIGLGVKTNTFNTPNVASREVFFLKHLHHARSIRNRTIEMFEIAALPDTSEEEKRRLLSFVIVGGGPTSCEYASELHDFLTTDLVTLYPKLGPYVKVTLVEAGPALLGPFESGLRDYVMRLFRKRKIDVRVDTAVTSVEVFNKPNYGFEATKAMLSNGEELEFGTMVWSAGLSPVKCTDSLDLEKSEQGRILTDNYLRVLGHEGSVWAIGDCAVMNDKPLPQLAQVAQQQAQYVAHIISGKKGDTDSEFNFFSLGSMASVGGGKGIYDGSHVGDPYGLEAMLPRMKGVLAWIAWRSAYWGKQVSLANKFLIPMYWFKSWAFGRDISKF
ncbi:hypothetical protein TrLO_g5442 [Triparma laevis f. longispina]|uniref:FAD/NAD(P)-binding domain-containing protein n=1 Tax=Triparma laevis f. longispina TaxID=1714387 RepID=A0A9W6ZQI6_9STRA|nr:hypothetical protein TrLO_g5442 [Triparma laevis f. longispina]